MASNLVVYLMGVSKLYLLFTTEEECMQEKGEKNVGKVKLYSLGTYPNAYVSFLRNQSYRSSAHIFLFVLCFLWTMLISPSAAARPLETYALAQKSITRVLSWKGFLRKVLERTKGLNLFCIFCCRWWLIDLKREILAIFLLSHERSLWELNHTYAWDEEQ